MHVLFLFSQPIPGNSEPRQIQAPADPGPRRLGHEESCPGRSARRVLPQQILRCRGAKDGTSARSTTPVRYRPKSREGEPERDRNWTLKTARRRLYDSDAQRKQAETVQACRKRTMTGCREEMRKIPFAAQRGPAPPKGICGGELRLPPSLRGPKAQSGGSGAQRIQAGLLFLNRPQASERIRRI